MSESLEELTAPGRGGLSVLRLRGPRLLERLRRLASDPLPSPGELRLVRLRAGGELLDEALVWYDGAGELELSLHGSPVVVRRIAGELDADLAHPEVSPEAPPGLDEEARLRLAAAPCEAAARVLLDQAEGALRRALEDLDPADGDAFDAGVVRLLERGRRAAPLLRPAVVALAGPVNAGKSTLFNVLVGHERVVVDEARGTTRDAVHERCLLGAYAVDLVDTAGEGDRAGEEVAAILERAAQETGRRVRERADLVLWLSREPEAGTVPLPGGPPHVRLTSASDLRPVRMGDHLSALTDPRGARETVERIFHESLDLPRRPWIPGEAVPFSPRLLRALEEARRASGENDRDSALAVLLAR